jgi:hypothetical protein
MFVSYESEYYTSSGQISAYAKSLRHSAVPGVRALRTP